MAQIIESIVWGLPAAAILTWAGIYFSFKGRFFQFRKIKDIITIPFTMEKVGEGPSGFSTLAAALGGTLGTGNIAGVAVAISVGGPGALFWMSVGALWGMATKFYEVYFAKKCKSPMGYMERVYKRRFLPSVFCVFCMCGALFGTGCAAQGAVFSETASKSFGIPLWLCGIICASWAAYSVFGGLKKTASVMAVVTPVICVLYLFVCFAVIWTFRGALPYVLKSIMESAFGFDAKGLAGAYLAFSTGLRRGVFSNEAGLATSPIIHARASSNAVSQALCGCFEVFFDTVVCAGATGIAILCARAPSALEAFCALWGAYGEVVYAFSMCFFALSSIPCWFHYGRICLEYLGLSKRAGGIYFALFVISAALSAFQSPASALWRSDILNGVMATINLPALILISKIVKPPKL